MGQSCCGWDSSVYGSSTYLAIVWFYMESTSGKFCVDVIRMGMNRLNGALFEVIVLCLQTHWQDKLQILNVGQYWIYLDHRQTLFVRAYQFDVSTWGWGIISFGPKPSAAVMSSQIAPEWSEMTTYYQVTAVIDVWFIIWSLIHLQNRNTWCIYYP